MTDLLTFRLQEGTKRLDFASNPPEQAMSGLFADTNLEVD